MRYHWANFQTFYKTLPIKKRGCHYQWRRANKNDELPNKRSSGITPLASLLRHFCRSSVRPL
jgi:hypothetical protein